MHISTKILAQAISINHRACAASALIGYKPSSTKSFNVSLLLIKPASIKSAKNLELPAQQ